MSPSRLTKYFIAIALLVTSITAAQAGIFTLPPTGFDQHRLDQRIGPSIREILRTYLLDSVHKQCGKHKKNPPACEQKAALYAGSALARSSGHPLPPAVLHKVGFVPPGADYVQVGFAVYLVEYPRMIIADGVTAWDDPK